ncbi:Maleylacetate reductase [Cladobotryum mycophilum]|uniref:Maleylacetate reductase n=1 Tax=Cladobotryum mycophilum TaxID=491253 RepID=A0ABR0SI47_9HYPO
MSVFEYTENNGRVLFGVGSLSRLPEELAKLGLAKPLLLTTPSGTSSHVPRLTELLGGHVVGAFTRAAMHTPTNITAEALEYSKSTSADCFVSIGGGSTVGLGKALSIRTGLPHISIPTTYAGSEMTPIVGETENGQKRTHVDRAAIPAVVIYDANLTLSLPPKLSATSGLNAMAHAVEALYAKDANPIASMFAVEGIRLLASSLPLIMNDPSAVSARSDALQGAWFCAKCLAMTSVSLHHKLCHVLGGSFSLPHAETHSIILPHALAYTAPSIPHVMQKLAGIIPHSDGDAIQGLNKLISGFGIPSSLRELGLKEEDVDTAADILISKPFWNPQPVEQGAIRELIRRAWNGEPGHRDL